MKRTLAVLIALAACRFGPSTPTPLQISDVAGKWESQTLGFASFTFDRQGCYFEIQEGIDAKTGRKTYHAEARGDFTYFIGSILLKQKQRTVTGYKDDGSVDFVRTFHTAVRKVGVQFTKTGQMRVIEDDGTKRIFDRRVAW